MFYLLILHLFENNESKYLLFYTLAVKTTRISSDHKCNCHLFHKSHTLRDPTPAIMTLHPLLCRLFTFLAAARTVDCFLKFDVLLPNTSFLMLIALKYLLFFSLSQFFLLPFVFPFLHLQDYARTLLTSFIRHPLHTWFA